MHRVDRDRIEISDGDLDLEPFAQLVRDQVEPDLTDFAGALRMQLREGIKHPERHAHPFGGLKKASLEHRVGLLRSDQRHRHLRVVRQDRVGQGLATPARMRGIVLGIVRIGLGGAAPLAQREPHAVLSAARHQ